jgi:hypothetical protein
MSVFVGIPSLLIGPLLVAGKMIYGADVVSVFHYSRTVIAESFRSGRLPVWDPHVMGGFPLLAAMQGAVFYPPTWLCVAMTPGTFWTSSVLLHLVLSGFLAHAWLRRGLGVGERGAIVGAVVFMISGQQLGRIYAGHVNYVWAYPWLAALAWRVERFLKRATPKRGASVALVYAMLLLAGAPQPLYLATLLVFVRLAYFVLMPGQPRSRRATTAGGVVGCLALGLLLGAPQLLPTIELIGQMQRGLAEDPRFLLEHSMSPKDLLGLAVSLPSTGSEPAQASYFWESSGLIGAGAVVLAATAFLGRHPQRFLWAGLVVGSVVLALGSHTPVYSALLTLVPGAAVFRAPGRFLLIFTLGSSALVASGFEALWRKERWKFKIPAVLLAAAAGVQLILRASALCLPEDPQKLRWSPEMQQSLRDRCGGEGRIASSGDPDLVAVGKCQAAGLDQVCGYDPMMLRRYAELMNAAQGVPAETRMTAMASLAPHPAMDLFAIRVWYTTHLHRAMVSDQPHPMPRAWLVNHAVVIESKDERLRTIVGDSFNPRKTVILEELPSVPPPVPTEKPAGTVLLISRAPGEYLLDAQCSADAYLVISEAYFPGWEAEIDGAPAAVAPADHLFQAVFLGPGRHRVRLVYHSRFLAAGMAAAVLATVGALGAVLIRQRREQLPLERLPGAP